MKLLVWKAVPYDGPGYIRTSTMEDVENSFTQDGRVNAEKYGNVMNAQYYYIV